MRQRETITIGDKEITIKELKVKEILFLCCEAGWIPSLPDVDLKNEENLPLYELGLSFVSDLTNKDFLNLAPSDLKKLYDVFMDVNKTTISVAKHLGLDKIVENMKGRLVSIFASKYEELLSEEEVGEVKTDSEK